MYKGNAAFHLDLVPALNVQSFIKSLKRFLARRGVNKLFVSDNAKTFKSQDVQQFVRSHGIEWKFNMPRSSCFGGEDSLQEWYVARKAV